SALERMRWAPAGDLYTSAGEISHFLLAQLADGRLSGGNARILREDTARTMHARAFSHRPALEGWCLGFDERSQNGVRAIGHGGSWHGYGTEVVLVPEQRLGLFVSTTRDNDPRFFRPLLRAFFDRYFPAAARTQHATVPGAERSARDVAGRYIANRRIRRDFLKLSLLLSSLRIDARPDGSLQITTNDPDGVHPVRAVPGSTALWQSEREERHVAALRSPGGAVEHVAIDAWSFDRVSFWGDPEGHTLVLGGGAPVCGGPP